MGVVFSKSTIITAQISIPTTAAALISALDTQLSGAGWPRSSYLGGYQYRLVAPAPQDTLACKLRIWDAGVSGRIAVQFLSDDETRVGVQHSLLYNVGVGSWGVYTVWANCCSVFIGLYQYSGYQGGMAVAGGVPFALGQVWGGSCGDQPQPGAVSEIWWSSGDDDAGSNKFSPNGCIRYSYICRNWFDQCYNGNLLSVGAGVHSAALDVGTLQLLPLRVPVIDIWSGYFANAGLVWWHPAATGYVDIPVRTEPYLLWADGQGLVPELRGQIYDAFMASRQYPPDDTETLSDYDPITGTFMRATWTTYMTTYGAWAGNDDSISYLTSMKLMTGIEILGGGGLANYVY